MIALPDGASEAERLAALDWAERWARIQGLDEAALLRLAHNWRFWRRDAQRAPMGLWRIWLITAGRGYGKTRAGAEWVRRVAENNNAARIALVGATMAEARDVMVEGESGLLAVCPEDCRPKWEPSLGRLRWPGGAQARIFSAAEPDSLRGPQHHAAWCDEIAKWPMGEAAWDNLMFGLRRGHRPQAVATTTPRAVPLLRRLMDEEGVVVTSGRTADNRAHLADGFIAGMEELYGGTRLGRQELDGELIEDIEGALWTRELIDGARHSGAPIGKMKRIVVGVDPPASAAGTCGIVAAGLGADGIAYVLGDHSVTKAAPERWARAVVAAAEAHGADCAIVETNQGGDMVQSVLKSADAALPVRPARARFGKGQRAQPVAMLFTAGKARFAGCFPELEDELAGLTAGGPIGGRSPDRADAMVWALSELMLGKERGEPRVFVL